MQTVSFAGQNYAIPTVRGDTPWSGLSDFVVAAAAKAINTGGGNFTLLADINFGATFGVVSSYFTSRSSNAAAAGAVRLASADVINWRNNANSANISLSKNTSDELQWNSTKLLISGSIVNADVNAAAAIAYSKLNLAGSIVNADINAAASIAYAKLAALTASRALQSGAGGVIEVSAVTSTELGRVAGVTSAIQTQIDAKAPTASPTFTGNPLFPAGLVGAPGIAFSGDPNTGIYSVGADNLGISTGNGLIADFAPFSSTQTTTNRLMSLRSGNGREFRHSLLGTRSITTTPVIIQSLTQNCTLCWVMGTDGGSNRFADLVLTGSLSTTVTVVASHTVTGTPAVRTYAKSSADLTLAFASGTYDVTCAAIGTSA